MKGFIKDPQAILDYSIDWSQWLGTDTISTSSWVVESPLAVVPASESFTDTVTTLFLTGGSAGENYSVTNTISTVGSRTDERSIEIRIRDR